MLALGKREDNIPELRKVFGVKEKFPSVGKIFLRERNSSRSTLCTSSIGLPKNSSASSLNFWGISVT